jgi:hypothetical protein
MLQKFSWAEYWTVVIAGVAVYYAIVFLLLFRNGLLTKPPFKRPVISKAQQPLPAVAPAPALQGKSVAKLQNEAEIENQLKKLTEELLQFLQDIAGRSYIKEEIIMGLQVIIREYKEFSETNYRSDIDDFMKVETENHCSVDLSDDEIERVWMG